MRRNETRKKKQTDKHTLETANLTKKNRTEKYKWKRARNGKNPAKQMNI
jgi:hypothetical protein